MAAPAQLESKIAAPPQSASWLGRSAASCRNVPRTVVAFYILLVTVVAYLAFAWPLDSGVKVTREELGPAWPLTISEGILRCESGHEITLQRGGTTYTLNRQVEHGAYSDIGPIRADDPAGGKKDLSPLTERGTRLCH